MKTNKRLSHTETTVPGIEKQTKQMNIKWMILSCMLFAGLMSGCEDKIEDAAPGNYYELNRHNSARLLSGMAVDMMQENRFVIVHISDAHLSNWSSNNFWRHPENLIEAVNFVNRPPVKVNAMVATGDFISNMAKTTRQTAMEYMNAFATHYFNSNLVPSFVCTGNHDGNMINPNAAEWITQEDFYSAVTSRINYPVYTDGRSNYYYTDMPDGRGGRIRIIALDELDRTDDAINTQQKAAYSPRQIAWFTNVALRQGMTSRHSVIVLMHHSLPSDNTEARRYIANEHVYSWYMIPEIIEAFRSKTHLEKRYPNKIVPGDTLTVDADFTQVPGEFICYMGGHVHTYLNYEVSWVPNINRALPKQQVLVANNMSPSEKNPVSPIERFKRGTQNNTFNIYAIDTREKMIYVTFFGATLAYYPRVIALNYGNAPVSEAATGK